MACRFPDREKRSVALKRLIGEKIGAEIIYLEHLATTFMIPNYGYTKSVDPDKFIFDDKLIELRNEHVQPRSGIFPHWVATGEVEELINNDQIEPNAASLLINYLQST